VTSPFRYGPVNMGTGTLDRRAAPDPTPRRDPTRASSGAPREPDAPAAPGDRPLLDGVLLAASIALVAVLVKVAWPRFTWFGDNAESFFPLWHIVGSALRDGHWLRFDPGGFAGGDIAGEAAAGIYNPVTLLNAVLVSGFDELGRASFLVMAEFLVLLGVGTQLLARAHGAARPAAFVAGLIVPFGGFTLFYDAGDWASGLMALTWVTWAWWGARRYAVGAGGPLPAVVFAGLAITVGNPYSMLGLTVVYAALAIELLVTGDRRRLAGLLVAGLCAATCALVTYLPLVVALPVTDRGAMSTISNNSYAAPSLGDLVGLSSPSLLPEFRAWTGTSDKVPSVYLSWVVLPLLPWLRWRGLRWRDHLGLLLATGVSLLMTIGPDQLWLFRWPIRMVEYTWVGLAVGLAVVLSRGLATGRRRVRASWSAAVVAFGFFLAWSSTPQELVRHLAVALLVAALTAALVVAGRRRGLVGVAAVVLVGTALITPLQARVFNWDGQPVVPDLDLGRASDLATVQAATATYRGTVLQVSDLFAVQDPEAVLSGHVSFGQVLAASGQPTLNRYSGIGFTDFQDALAMDYRGSVHPAGLFDRLYADLPGYDAPLIDALGVDTLVVGRAGSVPTDALPRPDWRVVLADQDRTVLQRVEIPAGPQVTPGAGVSVSAAREVGAGARFTTTATGDSTVLLDRLAWPGYRATTSDGTVLELAKGPAGLLQVQVPQGTSAVQLDYRVPGERLGILAGLGGLLLALVHQLLWWRSRRVPIAGPTGSDGDRRPTSGQDDDLRPGSPTGSGTASGTDTAELSALPGPRRTLPSHQPQPGRDTPRNAGPTA